MLQLHLSSELTAAIKQVADKSKVGDWHFHVQFILIVSSSHGNIVFEAGTPESEFPEISMRTQYTAEINTFMRAPQNAVFGRPSNSLHFQRPSQLMLSDRSDRSFHYSAAYLKLNGQINSDKSTPRDGRSAGNPSGRRR